MTQKSRRRSNNEFHVSAAGEERLTVRVLPGGNPVSCAGEVYGPGDVFELRSTLADALVAQGRVAIVEED